MSAFVHAWGIKTVHEGRGVKKGQNSVHVLIECPLIIFVQKTRLKLISITFCIFIQDFSRAKRKELQRNITL